MEANAQQIAPASPPSQAYAPSQRAATQAYAQARRYARRAPAAAAPAPAAAGPNLVYGPGSGAPPYAFNVPGQRYALAPWEWHAAPPRTDAATCASRTRTPCAGMGIKRRVNNERRSPLTLSPAPMRGFFFAGRSTRHLGGGFAEFRQ
jgi:hypothetical protein